MFGFDAIQLARTQFAFTVIVHTDMIPDRRSAGSAGSLPLRPTLFLDPGASPSSQQREGTTRKTDMAGASTRSGKPVPV